MSPELAAVAGGGLPAGCQSWTLEEWIEKEPKLLTRLTDQGHPLAKNVHAAYFSSPYQSPQSAVKAPRSRSVWTLEDYLDNDPEALVRLETENPALLKRLETAYFNEN